MDSAVGLKLDLVRQSIELVELVLDHLLQCLLQSWAHDLQHHWLTDGEQNLVLGLLQLDVEVLNIDINLVNLEEVLTVLLLGSRHLHLEAETTSTEEDISNTSVGKRWEPLLLLDVERDITEVHLDTRDREHDAVSALVGNLLSAPSEVVVWTTVSIASSKEPGTAYHWQLQRRLASSYHSR